MYLHLRYMRNMVKDINVREKKINSENFIAGNVLRKEIYMFDFLSTRFFKV